MKNSISTKDIINKGLLAGLISFSLSVIGFISLLGGRELIKGGLTLGHVFLIAAPFAFAYLSTKEMEYEGKAKSIGVGFAIGAIAAIPLVFLIFIATTTGIREFLANVSPALAEFLSFGLSPVPGSLLLLIVFGLAGALASGLSKLPEKIHHPLVSALIWTLGIAIFSLKIIN